jgi:hypothetical protein
MHKLLDDIHGVIDAGKYLMLSNQKSYNIHNCIRISNEIMGEIFFKPVKHIAKVA